MEAQIVDVGRTAKRAPVSLLHLPDELLLQVISYPELRPRDLYALSMQCKRLQRLCLPLYLLAVGVTTPLISPVGHLDISWKHFCVPGIPLTFCAKGVKKISIDIGCNLLDREPESHYTASALQRLRRMIVNIEGLEHMVFRFGLYLQFAPLVDRNLTETWIQLLDAIANHCTGLSLTSDVHPSPLKALEKEARKWITYPLHNWGPFKALRERGLLGFLRSRSLHAAAHRSYALKRLTFQSNLSLLPALSGWAFKVLNTAPLTRLDLIEVALSSHFSAIIFGALTIPTLEHLCIINRHSKLCFDSLLKFLSRHDTISKFDIISQDTIQTSLPRAILPKLISLKSDAGNIPHLLTRTGAFPKLAHVCVVIDLPSPGQFTFDAVGDSHVRAAKRLTMTNIRLRMEVHRESYHFDLVGLETYLGNYPVLSHVREIAFVFPPPNVVTATAVLSWLSLFPSLEHIEFMNTEAGLDDQMPLIRLLVQKCTTLRSIAIGEDTRDVSAWLSSKYY